MGRSLAVQYRPTDFDSMLGQRAVIKTLEEQLKRGRISNCYLFAGPSGDGKTTISKVLASKINGGRGTPIEIDGASHNGVDAVREIIEDAKNRSIDSEYKIYIIDECHAITSAAWSAFLKCLEEPPQFTIFMFCTTNPEKIPEAILNRMMRFNLSKVDTGLIRDRLRYICQQEGFTNYEEACDYLAKLGSGGVRDSIAYLEKCAAYSTDLSIENVLSCLGNLSYDDLFDLTGALLNQEEGEVLKIIEAYYNAGSDLKVFLDSYLEFCLDLTKYCLFHDMQMVKIPGSLSPRCEGYSQVPRVLEFSNNLVDNILKIKMAVKYDLNPRSTIEAMLIRTCREC